MKYIAFFLLCITSMFSASCGDDGNCRNYEVADLEGFEQGSVTVLENNPFVLKPVKILRDFVYTWQLANGEIIEADSVVIPSMNDSMVGKITLEMQSSFCREAKTFYISMMDLTPDCYKEENKLFAVAENGDTTTIGVLGISTNRSNNGDWRYDVKLSNGGMFHLTFSIIPEPGKYSFTGGFYPDGFEKYTVGTFFDFGFIEYGIPQYGKGKSLYVRRENGKLRVAFCSVPSFDDWTETWRNMTMEFDLP